MEYPNDRSDTPLPPDDDSTWTRDKRYIEGKIRDFERGLTMARREASDAMKLVSEQLAEIQLELRAYKKAWKIILAVGSVASAIIGWFLKGSGKG